MTRTHGNKQTVANWALEFKSKSGWKKPSLRAQVPFSPSQLRAQHHAYHAWRRGEEHTHTLSNHTWR